MLGGFTFKGVHSSVYGVRETPSSRVLSPRKRRTLIEIPGRSASFIQEDGGYEARQESILCSYAAQEGVDLHMQVRRIAGWLNGVGELTFDYEPTMHYSAYLDSAPPTVKMLEFAQFTLDFTIAHPFAYETAVQQKQSISNNEIVEVVTNGTVETPVRIIIKNLTNKTITSIKLVHRFIEEI